MGGDGGCIHFVQSVLEGNGSPIVKVVDIATFVDQDRGGSFPGGWDFRVNPAVVKDGSNNGAVELLPGFFQAAYERWSGPGAELGFVRFSVLETSSSVKGASRRSVGVTPCHSWMGGGPVGVLGSTAPSLVRKYSPTVVTGTVQRVGGGDLRSVAMQHFGCCSYAFWVATMRVMVRFLIGFLACWGLGCRSLGLLFCCRRVQAAWGVGVDCLVLLCDHWEKTCVHRSSSEHHRFQSGSKRWRFMKGWSWEKSFTGA